MTQHGRLSTFDVILLELKVARLMPNGGHDCLHIVLHMLELYTLMSARTRSIAISPLVTSSGDLYGNWFTDKDLTRYMAASP